MAADTLTATISRETGRGPAMKTGGNVTLKTGATSKTGGGSSLKTGRSAAMRNGRGVAMKTAGSLTVLTGRQAKTESCCGFRMYSAAVITILLMLICANPPQVSAQSSLYQDVKANEIGDIITVILVENISGSSSSDARRSSSSDGSASGSVSGNFLPFEPVFGSDVNVDYGSDERNLSNQGQLLEGNMSVQIVEISSRGDLIVEGNRVTEINGEIHEMHLTGIVRSNDIDSRNQVLSYRVADANIKYQKQGGAEELKKRRGFLRRVVFTGIGVLLSAAIIAREL